MEEMKKKQVEMQAEKNDEIMQKKCSAPKLGAGLSEDRIVPNRKTLRQQRRKKKKIPRKNEVICLRILHGGKRKAVAAIILYCVDCNRAVSLNFWNHRVLRVFRVGCCPQAQIARA